MGLFSTKKEEKTGLPTLPDLSDLPDIPEANEDSHLQVPEFSRPPEFLRTPRNLNVEVNPLRNLHGLERSKFSHEQIKSAVNKPEENMHFQGMQKSRFEKFLPPLASPLREPMEVKEIGVEEMENEAENKIITKAPRESINRKEEPIFIRIDKFQMAVEVLQEIRNKISDIERVLNKTKEIKRQEEIEIEEWKKEVQILKSRLETIDRELFSKLD